jgi:hypothetical protein
MIREPPPNPIDSGIVTPIQSNTDIIASTAFPPSVSMSLLFGFNYDNHFKNLYCNKSMNGENSGIFSTLNRTRIRSYLLIRKVYF